MGDVFDTLTVEKYDIIRKSRNFLSKFGYDIMMDFEDGIRVYLGDGSCFPILKRNGDIKLSVDYLLAPASLYFAKIYFQPCKFRLHCNSWFAIPKSDGYYPYDAFITDACYMSDEYGNDGDKIINFAYTGGELDDIAILKENYNKPKVKK